MSLWTEKFGIYDAQEETRNSPNFGALYHGKEYGYGQHTRIKIVDLFKG